MEHLRQSILEAESKTGRRLTELRREFNKLAAGKLSKEHYKYLGSFKDPKKRLLNKPIKGKTHSGNKSEDGTTRPWTLRDNRLMKRPSTWNAFNEATGKVLRSPDRDQGWGYDVDTCAKQCEKDNKGYDIFGLQDGGQCFCGKKAENKYKSSGEYQKGTRAAHCWSARNESSSHSRQYYGPVNPSTGRPIGLENGTRVKPGEGGKPWCNNVYKLKAKTKIKDVGNQCYNAETGALGKKYENITPQECVKFFGNDAFAIDAYANEYGRLTCYKINDRSKMKTAGDPEPSSDLVQIKDLTEKPAVEHYHHYPLEKVCADPEEHADYVNATGRNIYRIVKAVTSGASSGASSKKIELKDIKKVLPKIWSDNEMIFKSRKDTSNQFWTRAKVLAKLHEKIKTVNMRIKIKNMRQLKGKLTPIINKITQNETF